MADRADLERLIKLLKMTTAHEDTVTLVAIRKANEELSRLGHDWEALLRGKVTIVEDPFKSFTPPPSRAGYAPPPPPVRTTSPSPSFYQYTPTPPPRAAAQPPKPARPPRRAARRPRATLDSLA